MNIILSTDPKVYQRTIHIQQKLHTMAHHYSWCVVNVLLRSGSGYLRYSSVLALHPAFVDCSTVWKSRRGPGISSHVSCLLEERYQTLSHFSLLHMIESWVEPGNGIITVPSLVVSIHMYIHQCFCFNGLLIL